MPSGLQRSYHEQPGCRQLNRRIACIDPDHIGDWWGPDGFTITTHVMDVRPGGTWRFVMHAPDGSRHQMVKAFVDVLPNERIVLRHQEPPNHTFPMTMTFEARGGGTRLTWRMRVDSASELARVRAVIETANEENFDRLAAFLAQA